MRLLEIVVDTGIQIWNAYEVNDIEFPVWTPLLPFLQLEPITKQPQNLQLQLLLQLRQFVPSCVMDWQMEHSFQMNVVLLPIACVPIL